MMSVSEFFSSEPEPPWIVDVAADLASYTDMHQLDQNEASTSTVSSTTSLLTTTNLESRTVTDMEIDMPSTSSESSIEGVIAHLFMLREIESVRPFKIEDQKVTTGGARRNAAGRSKASRKRKFDQMIL